MDKQHRQQRRQVEDLSEEEFAFRSLNSDRTFDRGIQEPKSKMEQLEVQYTLSDYADFVETTVGGAFDTVVVHQRDTLLINGIHCQTVDFNAAVMSDESPLEVYYHLAVFEAEDQFYQLIGWSERDRQSAFRDAVLAMEQSFQVCGNPSGQFQTASAAKLR